jgi:hypothetical protein
MTEKKCWRYTTLGDWSGDYSPFQITEHDKLPDHARALVYHSPTMLGDLSTTTYAVLEDYFDHSPITACGLVSSATCEI